MLKLIKRLKSKKSGFTLIELIVVIAILGILAAVLVPSILGYVDEANEKTAKANAHSFFQTAQLAYVEVVQAKDASTLVTSGLVDQASDNDVVEKIVTLVPASAVFKVEIGASGITKIEYDGYEYDGANYTAATTAA